MTSTIPPTLNISVIIPTFNEEENLESLLDFLQDLQGLEIIVADGGSRDRTLQIAGQNGVKIVHSQPGRGTQLNEGARIAACENLVFLHCDTRLSSDFPDVVATTLARPGTAAGAFRLRIDAAGSGYRIIEWGANIRSRFLKLPYGDQALFLRKDVFERAGGFLPQPLLEDLEFVRRLKKVGRIHIVPAAAVTSPRRWVEHGLVKTTLLNQAILIGYLCGIRPVRLAGIYNRGALRQRRGKEQG